MRVAIAGEGARIIASLKRLMKARSITYKVLAGRIKLSESPSNAFSLRSVSRDWSRFVGHLKPAFRDLAPVRGTNARRPKPSAWNRSLAPTRIFLPATT
jgi:hypothetical protein